MQLIISWVSLIAVATTIMGVAFPVSAGSLEPMNVVLRPDAAFFIDRSTTFRSLFDYNYSYYDYFGSKKPLDSLLIGVLPKPGYSVNLQTSGYPAAVIGDKSFWDPDFYGWSPLYDFSSTKLFPNDGFSYSASIPIRYNWTGAGGRASALGWHTA